MWKRRESRLATAWRFDRELKFQYWGAFKNTEEGKKEISETLSLLGACWFMDREWFWELGGCDENHGSWGQMGTEIACKSWLSGGRLVCNKRTWFGHLFRTKGGDFGFPYPISGNQVSRARKYSRELWTNNRWPGQKHSFEWLIKKFAPVPGWDDYNDKPTKGIVYYSDCRGDKAILEAAQKQIARAANSYKIVSVTLAPVNFGDVRKVLDLERGYLTMFKQILAGIEASSADIIFFCEHDVLYHPSHFDFTPPDKRTIYYNENTWKVDAKSGHALYYICRQTSGLCAYREVLLEHYRKRVALVEKNGFSRSMGFEPGTHGRAERVDDLKSASWMSEFPNIDIRHGQNLTPSRWRKDQFRNRRSCRGWTEADEVPGWGKTKGRFAGFLENQKNEGV